MVQMEAHVAEYEKKYLFWFEYEMSPRFHVLHLGPQSMVLFWKNIDLWGSNIK